MHDDTSLTSHEPTASPAKAQAQETESLKTEHTEHLAENKPQPSLDEHPALIHNAPQPQQTEPIQQKPLGSTNLLHETDMMNVNVNMNMVEGKNLMNVQVGNESNAPDNTTKTDDKYKLEQKKSTKKGKETKAVKLHLRSGGDDDDSSESDA